MNAYGSPLPTSAVAEPIWLVAGHVPAVAAGSAHSLTDGIAPTSPLGRKVVSADRYCCSARAREVEGERGRAERARVRWAVSRALSE